MKTILCCLLLAFPAFAQNTELPLKAGDRIALSIGGITDSDAAQISKVYSVSDRGTINLVHVGEVKAAGLKPSALQHLVEQAYIKGEIYTKPVVNISIDGGNTPDRMVYIVSGCKKNGAVAYNAGMTVLKAISVAGGLNEFARPAKTKLIRGGVTTQINLNDISAKPDRDIPLQPEDQIIVPDN